MKKIKIISEGKNKRECVEKTKDGSKTFHQTLVKGKWVNNIDLPSKKEGEYAY